MSRALPGALLFTLLLGYTLGGGCDPVPLGDGTRRAGIKAVASDLMVPGLEALVTDAQALAAAIEAAAGEPTTARLDEARAGWRVARAAWKRVEPVRLGPVLTERLGTRLDQSPVEADKVIALARTATLTPAAIGVLGANRLGFHALEALLFGDDAAWTDARHGRLASIIAGLLAEDAAQLRDLWVAGYARQFGDIGANDAAFSTAADAMDALVNALIAHTERILISRLGKPIGHDSGGVPMPELQESPLADASVDDLLDNLDGIEAAYVTGLAPVVSERSPAVDRRVRAALVEARARLSAVPRPFAQALTDQAPEVETAYDGVSAVWTLLRTEVVGTLGAVLKLNDNDGD